MAASCRTGSHKKPTVDSNETTLMVLASASTSTPGYDDPADEHIGEVRPHQEEYLPHVPEGAPPFRRQV